MQKYCLQNETSTLSIKANCKKKKNKVNKKLT